MIAHPITLTGEHVRLEPLQTTHRDALLAAAADGELWASRVTVVPDTQTIDAYLARAIAGRDQGTMLPFAIVDRRQDRVVGSTRFWKIDPVNRKLEIGHTWLAASAQRTGINTEAKFLLLVHAFEALHCIRVQFTTDELNVASRTAILRLGAVFEEIIRHERIMPDGRKRNSARFSIVDDEWPTVKARLQKKMTVS